MAEDLLKDQGAPGKGFDVKIFLNELILFAETWRYIIHKDQLMASSGERTEWFNNFRERVIGALHKLPDEEIEQKRKLVGKALSLWIHDRTRTPMDFILDFIMQQVEANKKFAREIGDNIGAGDKHPHQCAVDLVTFLHKLRDTFLCWQEDYMEMIKLSPEGKQKPRPVNFYHPNCILQVELTRALLSIGDGGFEKKKQFLKSALVDQNLFHGSELMNFITDWIIALAEDRKILALPVEPIIPLKDHTINGLKKY